MPSKRRTIHRPPPGATPGTLTADPGAPKPEIRLICYGPDGGPDGFREQAVKAPRDLSALPPGHTVRWIDVAGLGDAATIREIGEMFGLHPLALADIVNVNQRPKVEAYDGHLFIVTRMPLNPEAEPHSDAPEVAAGEPLQTEQVAICIGHDFVITFQEQPGDVFDPVRTRLRAAAGKIRSRGSDYLAYALLDAAIDSFFPLLEDYGERVEDLEQDVVERAGFRLHGADPRSEARPADSCAARCGRSARC